MRCYFALFHEATALNLLEGVLYHAHAAEALGDALVDLCDYAVRGVTALIAHTHAARSTTAPPAIAAKVAAAAASSGGGDVGREHLMARLAARHPAGSLFLADALDGDDDGSSSSGGGGSGGGGVGGSSEGKAALLKAVAADAAVPPRRAAARQMRMWMADIAFQRGLACVTILRYLSDHITKVPLTVATRLLDMHDLPLLVLPLIENPPWVRKSKGMDGRPTWQKFVDRAWVDVAPDALLKLTPAEGQPWLTLYNLLVEPECRKRYALHSHRKGSLLRVRKYLNEVLLDQLPLLADVQRYLDEISVAAVPEATDVGRGAFLLEAVPEVQDALVKEALTPPSTQPLSGAAASSAWAGEGDGGMLQVVARGSHGSAGGGASDGRSWTWDDLGAWVAEHIFPATTSSTSSRGGGGGSGGKAAVGDEPLVSVRDLQAMAQSYGDEGWLEEMLGEPKCAVCGEAATKRCSRCKNAWYCSRECQVGDWKSHKTMCDVVAGAGK